jgi:hypothetical protein
VGVKKMIFWEPKTKQDEELLFLYGVEEVDDLEE